MLKTLLASTSLSLALLVLPMVTGVTGLSQALAITVGPGIVADDNTSDPAILFAGYGGDDDGDDDDDDDDPDDDDDDDD